MKVRIVSEAEVRGALAYNDSLSKDLDYVLGEIDALREYLAWPDRKRRWADNPNGRAAYALTLLDEIERVIESVPKPLTADDLQRERC